MSNKRDPALYDSGYERLAGDRYFTEPWLTNVLMRYLLADLLEMEGKVWEPAAGRGDMARVLMDRGLEVFASDIDTSEFDRGLCDAMQLDFLNDDFDPALMGLSAIVTNPPYSRKAEKFLRRALAYKDIRIVAMLMRTEFSSGSRRVDLFEQEPFAYEIKIVDRPRWDWWFREPQPDDNGPRHNFSWFVWDRAWEGRNTTYWARKALKENKKGR